MIARQIRYGGPEGHLPNELTAAPNGPEGGAKRIASGKRGSRMADKMTGGSQGLETGQGSGNPVQAPGGGAEPEGELRSRRTNGKHLMGRVSIWFVLLVGLASGAWLLWAKWNWLSLPRAGFDWVVAASIASGLMLPRARLAIVRES